MSAVFVLTALLLANLSATVTLTWWVTGVAPVFAGIWILLAVWAALLLARSGVMPEFRRGMRRNWQLWPFVAFSLITVIWSSDPSVSISWWLVLLANVVVGGFIGVMYDARKLASYFGQALIIVLALSLLVVVLYPEFGVMYYYTIQGAWKGIFWHKNHMGIVAGLASILLLINVLGTWKPRKRSFWWWAAFYVLSLGFLVQTDSAASYLSVIAVHGLVVLGFVHLHLRQRLRRVHYLVLAAFAILVVLIVLLNLDAIFGVFNRNVTLTGRVPMWGHLFRVFLSERPIGGYGLNAFWHIADHRNTMQELAGYPDPIVISDNGFIDILINTGVIGLLCFLVFYLILWFRVVRRAWRASTIYGLLGLIVMAYGVMANVTWSLLFESESLLMLMMISIMFSTGAEHRAESEGSSE